MKGKKIILRILLVLIALIVVASLYFYSTLPHWKGVYIRRVGLFLTINLLIIAFLSTKISRNDILEFKAQNICNFFPFGAFFPMALIDSK